MHMTSLVVFNQFSNSARRAIERQQRWRHTVIVAGSHSNGSICAAEWTDARSLHALVCSFTHRRSYSAIRLDHRTDRGHDKLETGCNIINNNLSLSSALARKSGRTSCRSQGEERAEVFWLLFKAVQWRNRSLDGRIESVARDNVRHYSSAVVILLITVWFACNYTLLLANSISVPHWWREARPLISLSQSLTMRVYNRKSWPQTMDALGHIRRVRQVISLWLAHNQSWSIENKLDFLVTHPQYWRSSERWANYH